MINLNHALKVAAAWISIVYAVCFAMVASFPGSRVLFMRYSMHADVAFTSSFFSFGYFLAGLAVWNVIALLAVWLFVALFNGIKK